MLPFTSEQFFAIFAAYGRTVWPGQIIAYLFGFVCVAALAYRSHRGSAVILGVLSVMWAVTGLGYHLLFFTRINNAAFLFAAIFVVQAVAFAIAAARSDVRFAWRGGLSGVVGIGLVLYAAVGYPLIGLAIGHAYLELPAFGITPCPLALFTFGMILLTVAPVPGWLFVIPVVWSVIGGTAAFLLAVPQDWILLFSGAATLAILYLRRSAAVTASTPGPGPAASA